jgi:hypothetical protein
VTIVTIHDSFLSCIDLHATFTVLIQIPRALWDSNVKSAADTIVCCLLEGVSTMILIIEPMKVSGYYHQRYISNGPKTGSDGILEPLLMTFSVAVLLSTIVVQ